MADAPQFVAVNTSYSPVVINTAHIVYLSPSRTAAQSSYDAMITVRCGPDHCQEWRITDDEYDRLKGILLGEV